MGEFTMMRPLWDLHWWDEASVDSLLSSVHEVGHERRDVLDLNRNWRRCDDDQLGLMRLHEQKLSLQDSPLAFGADLLCYTRTSVLRFNTLGEDAESFALCTVLLWTCCMSFVSVRPYSGLFSNLGAGTEYDQLEWYS
jgi:hypothetical protein